MLKDWIRASVLVPVVAAAMVADAAAQAVTIRVGFSDPISTPWGQGLSEFKRIVESESNGRIAVQLFPSEQLGSLVEMVENVRQGAQEISLASPGWFSQFYPRIDVLELPFLVTDWDQARRMLESKAFRNLARAAEAETGLLIYAKFPYGFRNVANSRRPVNTLEDLAGLKLRVQNTPVHLATFRALGASPVALAWGETYQAVQSGVVDGLENANTVLLANKFPEIAKYISVTNHLFGMLLAYINPDFYNGLSDGDRELIDRAMAAAEDLSLRLALKQSETALDELRKLGAEVNVVPPEEIERMRQAVQSVYAEFGPRFEPDLSALQQAADGG
jgi:tripartite ATP-independent transporter DctP family solute receptor